MTLDDAGDALQLLACTRQIQQGAARLEAYASAGAAAAREYEHCKNALGQLVGNSQVFLSEPYRSEADAICEGAAEILNSDRRIELADALVQRAERLYRRVQDDQKRVERVMSNKPSIIESYFIGTDVLISAEPSVIGRRAGGGGWTRHGDGWIGPGGRPVFAPSDDIYPIFDVTDEDVIGEIESVLGDGYDMGTPGMPISIPDDSPVGHPIVVGGGGAGAGHHRHRGRGWGRGWGRGFGYGYPWGPPLDYGYTTVVKEDNTLADLAIAEAIAKNTELQQKLLEKESREGREGRDWDRAREGKKGKRDEDEREEKSVVGGHGGHRHGGGARGFYRGGWYGGDYPPPFAYFGPYEDVDTVLEQSAAENALDEVLRQNDYVEKQLDAKARMVGGTFEDFDNRTVWYTGKMRGGR